VFKVEREGEQSHVYLFRDAYRKGVGLLNEAAFSATVVVLQAMTESDITPIEVSFQHTAPKSLQSHQGAFRCPILFNQAHNRITFRTSDLGKRTAKADASINQFLLERVEEEKRRIEISAIK
jgi:hypothetical protein